MKKLNKKGATLIELIVSFALVGVAIVYFFQTLYTVKKVYANSRQETNEFAAKSYALRMLNAYIDNGEDYKKFCRANIVECSGVSDPSNCVSGICDYKINGIKYQSNNGTKTTSVILYK